MSVAKGKFFVSKEQLQKMLLLPDGVEILAIKPKEFEDGFEFIIVSAEETKVTKKNIPIGQLRRSSLIVEEVPVLPFDLPSQHSRKVTSNQINVSVDLEGNVKLGESVRPYVNVEVVKQKESDVKAIFEDIVDGMRKRGTNIDS